MSIAPSGAEQDSVPDEVTVEKPIQAEPQPRSWGRVRTFSLWLLVSFALCSLALVYGPIVWTAATAAHKARQQIGATKGLIYVPYAPSVEEAAEARTHRAVRTMIAETNKSLPMQLNAITRFDRVAVDGNRTLIRYHTIVRPAGGDRISIADARLVFANKQHWQRSIREDFCTNPDIAAVRLYGYGLRSVYKSQDGATLLDLTFKPDVCKKNP